MRVANRNAILRRALTNCLARLYQQLLLLSLRRCDDTSDGQVNIVLLADAFRKKCLAKRRQRMRSAISDSK